MLADDIGLGIYTGRAYRRMLCTLIMLSVEGAKGLVGLTWQGLTWLRSGGQPTLAVLTAALVRGGCSPATIRVYLRCVDQLLRWSQQTGTCVTIPDGVAEYLAARKASGAQRGTLRLHLAAARKIFDKALDIPATEGLRYVPPPAPVQGASDESAAALFDATESTEERLLFLCTVFPLPARTACCLLIDNTSVSVSAGHDPQPGPAVRSRTMVLSTESQGATDRFRATLACLGPACPDSARAPSGSRRTGWTAGTPHLGFRAPALREHGTPAVLSAGAAPDAVGTDKATTAGSGTVSGRRGMARWGDG